MVRGFALLAACAAGEQIFQAETFNVRTVSNVTYASGMVCDDDSLSNCHATELLLDVYLPEAKEGGPSVPELKPAYVIAHGGGNSGGTKLQVPLVGSAKFHAARGFVAFSIDYRLSGKHGLYPKASESALTGSWDPIWASGYPAVRDCKAAIRFVRAHAKEYGIDASRIAVSGGSAGATDMLAVASSFEEDFKSELSTSEDPTLATTNLNQSSKVQVHVSHWAHDGLVNLAQSHDPANRTRYTKSSAPVIEFHGDVDTTIPLEHARAAQEAYAQTGVDYSLHVLEGCGHSAWCYDGKGACSSGCPGYADTMDVIALPFVARHLNLTLAAPASQSVLV